MDRSPWADPVAGLHSGLAGDGVPPSLRDGGRRLVLPGAALEAAAAGGVVVDAAAVAVPVAGLDVPVAAHRGVVRVLRAQLGLAAALARVALAEVDVLARPAAPVARLPPARHNVHLLLHSIDLLYIYIFAGLWLCSLSLSLSLLLALPSYQSSLADESRASDESS